MMFEKIMGEYVKLSELHMNFIRFALIYFGVTFAHFMASNMYASMCTPFSLIGYITMPFMIVAPHCKAFNWVIQYTGEQIAKTWIWIGGYLVLYVTNIMTTYSQTKTVIHEKTEEVDAMDSDSSDMRRTRRRMS